MMCHHPPEYNNSPLASLSPQLGTAALVRFLTFSTLISLNQEIILARRNQDIISLVEAQQIWEVNISGPTLRPWHLVLWEVLQNGSQILGPVIGSSVQQPLTKGRCKLSELSVKKWIHWCPQCVSKSPGLIGVQVLQVAHAFCLSNDRSFDFSLRSFNGSRPWWSRIAHWWGPRQPFHQRQSLPINCWCVVHPSLPQRAMKIGKKIWQTYQTIELWWVDNGWCGWSFSQVPWAPKKTHIGMSRVRSGIQLNLWTWLHLCARRNTKASPCAMAYISLQQVASAFMKWHQYWWNCNDIHGNPWHVKSCQGRRLSWLSAPSSTMICPGKMIFRCNCLPWQFTYMNIHI